ncbi:MAG TPA: hypothetical protein VNA69_13230 [Thermoanaerobaculia bacterium]|nr:hypothetical protein [Thermoanaerobaculia bacterium]
MSRYLQKISLRPYSDAEIWTGWELEGRSGEIEGLLNVDGLTSEEISKKYGVTEFQMIPEEYLQAGEFLPKT